MVQQQIYLVNGGKALDVMKRVRADQEAYAESIITIIGDFGGKGKYIRQSDFCGERLTHIELAGPRDGWVESPEHPGFYRPKAPHPNKKAKNYTADEKARVEALARFNAATISHTKYERELGWKGPLITMNRMYTLGLGWKGSAYWVSVPVLDDGQLPELVGEMRPITLVEYRKRFGQDASPR